MWSMQLVRLGRLRFHSPFSCPSVYFFLNSLLANEYSTDSFSISLCDLAAPFFSLISLRLLIRDHVSALIQFLSLFLFFLFPSTHLLEAYAFESLYGGQFTLST